MRQSLQGVEAICVAQNRRPHGWRLHSIDKLPRCGYNESHIRESLVGYYILVLRQTRQIDSTFSWRKTPAERRFFRNAQRNKFRAILVSDYTHAIVPVLGADVTWSGEF